MFTEQNICSESSTYAIDIIFKNLRYHPPLFPKTFFVVREVQTYVVDISSLVCAGGLGRGGGTNYKEGVVCVCFDKGKDDK
jgi:hypothetical protein